MPAVELRVASPGVSQQLLGINYELGSAFKRVGDAWLSDTWLAVPQVSDTPDGALFTLRLTNQSDAPATMAPLEIRFRGAAATSFCGASAFVVAAHEGRWLALAPLAGSYDAHPGDPGVCTARLAQPINPGMDFRLTWRARWFESLGQLQAQVLPSWYPPHDVVSAGESIELRFADGVITSEDVTVVEAFPDVTLHAVAGWHTVRAVEAKGVTELNFGWVPAEADLIGAALAADPDPGTTAFLMAQLALDRTPSDAELDRLDLSIAAGLERGDPLAVAAAVIGSRYLGSALLSEATAALAAIADDADRVPGTYLAAAQLAAHLALLGDSSKAAQFAELWGPREERSLEGTLICEPDRSAEVLRQLEAEVGWGLPQTQRAANPEAVALIGWLARSELLGELSLPASELHARLCSWNLCQTPTPRQLAWLTW